MLLTRTVRRFAELIGRCSPAQGGTGLDGSAAANGQLLIGKGDGFALATLTPGANVTITPGAGSIAIAASRGVPPGGTAGQLLAKLSGADYDEIWIDAPAAGSMAIGGAITGGTAGRLLFEGAGTPGVLADSANLTYDGVDLTIGGITVGPGTGIGNPAVFGTNATATGANAAAFGREASASGNAAVAFGPFAVASGAGSVAILGTASGADALAIGIGSVASHNFAIVFGDGCPSFGAGNVNFSTGFSDPVLSLTRFSSTDLRQIVGIRGTYIVSTDAEFTARATFGAYDWDGFREGIRVDSDGTQALVGFFGSPAVARPSGGLLAGIAALGLMASPTITTADVTGLGTAATHATGDFLQAANNLADVIPATARTNIGAAATHFTFGVNQGGLPVLNAVTNLIYIDRAMTCAGLAAACDGTPSGGSATIVVQSSTDGTTWATLGTVSIAAGAFAGTAALTSAIASGTYLRGKFTTVNSVTGMNATLWLKG